MKGCFRVSADAGNDRDILFERFSLGEGEAIPEEQLKLVDEVNRTLVILRAIFSEKNDIRFKQYFRQTLSLSQLGLVGDSATPDMAMRVLSWLQQDVIQQEAGRIKNKYMVALGKRCLISAGLAAWVLWFANCIDLAGPATIAQIWIGCMAGVWLSFGARKVVLKFDDLAAMEEDRLNPSIRVMFAGLLSVVVGLLLLSHSIVIKVGASGTDNLGGDGYLPLLVGVFCGLTEKALASRLSERAGATLKF